ncbi:MAG: aspartate carbamoyltransferase [Anaerolineae bacterium]|nr:aspartate carbamoyltransferase [Anaerolineae bacterium]
MTTGEHDSQVSQPNPFLTQYVPPRIDGSFTGKHIITVDQFARKDLQILFDAAASLRKRVHESDRGLVELCNSKVMASLFFEASTRTDLSFQAAMRRLGGKVISASNGVQFSSVYKGENLADTVRAAGCYADVLVLRHPQLGSSYEAAYYLDKLNQRIQNPTVIISGGDGIGEHPTQALLDMFTIYDKKKQFNHLTVTMVGDLRHGRTVHSLAKLLTHYAPEQVTVCLVSPRSLTTPREIVARLQASGISVFETSELQAVLGQSDVIYWTRVQEERFAADPQEYEAVKDDFIITPAVMRHAKPDAILMHPLPRKHEMGTRSDHDILDEDPRAVYFEQMENGMFIRMALLAKVLRGVYV